MNTQTLAAFKESIKATIKAVGAHPESTGEPYLRWRRETGTSWHGAYETKRHLAIGWDRQVAWDVVAGEFALLMQEHHPDHLGLIGTPLFRRRYGADDYVRAAVGALWTPSSGLDVPEPEIDRVVGMLAEFVDARTLRLHVLAPLVNFKSDREGSVQLGALGLTLRTLTDEEVSSIHGGSPFAIKQFDSWRLHEWAIESETELPKLLGDGNASDPLEALRGKLDGVVSALRTFKAGPVGYGGMVYRVSAGLFDAGRGTFGHEYIPLGDYALGTDEYEEFLIHLGRSVQQLHPAVQVASGRLAGCGLRLDPKDKLIDAVIGLEALLLTGKASERGELSFRFSMHYALLQDSASRAVAFRQAKTLYSERSAVAHGGHIREPIKFGEEHLTLAQVADRSVDMLRKTLRYFLALAPAFPPATDLAYWEKQYFS